MNSDCEQLVKEIEKFEGDGNNSSAILIVVSEGGTKLFTYQMNSYVEILGVLEIAKAGCVSTITKT